MPAVGGGGVGQAGAMDDGTLAAIGSTPLIRLRRLAGDGAAAVWVKMEAANPTGSYKDRMALAMIRGAERRGRLGPGQAVVEYTGGSTGSSLAFVCAVTGHPLHIVTSDAFALEKRRTMEAFGASVEVLASPAGITPDLIPRMRARAGELAAELGAYQTDQFRNTDMIEGYRRLGEELVAQLPGPVDALCSYVGTAGCFLGVSRAVRETSPQLHRVAVEPAESAVLSGGAPGTHRIEGGGVGFLPDLLEPSDFDEVVAVSTADAFEMARRAARIEGLLSGPSTGANLVAALAVADRLGPGRNVVTLQVDSGLKYLAGDLYDAT
jgi:cysteine synthase A